MKVFIVISNIYIFYTLGVYIHFGDTCTIENK